MVPFLPMERVWTDRLDMSETRPKEEVDSGYTRFAEDDILLPKITPTFEAGRAAIARPLPGGIGAGTTELHVLRPGPEVHPRWLLHFLNNETFLRRGHADMYGVAGQKRISEEFVKNYPVTPPPLDDQRRIAGYLDAETARIDKLITEQERLTCLLDEHVSAAIDNSVWRNSRQTILLRDLTPSDRKIMYGIVLPGPNVPEGVLLVKGGDVKVDRLDPDRLNRTTAEIEAPYRRARLRSGDIVYAIRGSIGDAELVPESLEGANITQDVARVSPKPGVDPRWLAYALKSKTFFGQMEAEARGATIRGINIWSLKRGRVPAIDEPQMARVADEIDARLAHVRAVRGELKRQIALLRERRQALITHAVTHGLDGMPGAA